jgi:hypothetical protein
MSYEKHTWETGETITAEKLNNLEDGVASGGGGGIFIVMKTRDSDQNPIFDKSWREIKNAYDENMLVITKEETDTSSDSAIDITYRIGFITDIEWYENGNNKSYIVRDSYTGESRESTSPDEWVDPQ